MKPRPLLSIVTVTLNPGAGLERTVESIRAQKFQDYEHIVKDGGSTDGSIENLAADPGLTIIRMPDRGIYDAMNQALAACRGEYVLFLNAGDSLAGPQALESVERALRSHQAALVYCDYVDHEMRTPIIGPSRLTRLGVYRTNICHQTWFVRRDVYERLGGFDVSFHVAADHHFLARAILTPGFVSRHVRFTAIAYQGSGFSRLGANRDKHRKELRRIRGIFPLPLRIAYGALLAVTLQEVRVWALDRPGSQRLRIAYVGIKNALRSQVGRGEVDE